MLCTGGRHHLKEDGEEDIKMQQNEIYGLQTDRIVMQQNELYGLSAAYADLQDADPIYEKIE